MRFLLVFTLIVNIALFAFGQGYLGPKPVNDGRSYRQFSQRMQQLLVLGTPTVDNQQNETNS